MKTKTPEMENEIAARFLAADIVSENSTKSLPDVCSVIIESIEETGETPPCNKEQLFKMCEEYQGRLDGLMELL